MKKLAQVQTWMQFNDSGTVTYSELTVETYRTLHLDPCLITKTKSKRKNLKSLKLEEKKKVENTY